MKVIILIAYVYLYVADLLMFVLRIGNILALDRVSIFILLITTRYFNVSINNQLHTCLMLNLW